MTVFIVYQWEQPFEVVVVHGLDAEPEPREHKPRPRVELVRERLQRLYVRDASRSGQFRVEEATRREMRISDGREAPLHALLDEDGTQV